MYGYWWVDFGVLHTTATEQLGDFVSALRNVARALEDEASGNDGEPN
ncbi:MAG: hypothetical protein ACRDRH_27215 [Pseudonocardia sp.]